MKWYHSVKFKLIGFFISISLFFLISVIAAFMLLRQEYLENRQNYIEYRLITQNQHIKTDIKKINRELVRNADALFVNMLIVTFLLTILATLIGYIALKAFFINPVESINKQLNQFKENEHNTLECSDRGEIGMLVQNFNRRTVNLAKSKARIAQEYQKRLANEEMLMQQSKMALMGEMMDSVAHQWKQPLNALTLYSELIRNDFDDGRVDKNYIEEYRKNLQIQIDHMVNTLDEFRSFFRPNKECVHFKLIDVVNSALFLAKDDILKHHILVQVVHKDDIETTGYPNEFKHLILNIINNAKDAFIQKAVEKRLIRIALISSANCDRLEICDNAGGISEEIIDHVFEANMTTKEKGEGSGIGLYMSQKIAHKHHANIEVENRDKGACFIITFKKYPDMKSHFPQDDRWQKTTEDCNRRKGRQDS